MKIKNKAFLAVLAWPLAVAILASLGHLIGTKESADQGNSFGLSGQKYFVDQSNLLTIENIKGKDFSVIAKADLVFPTKTGSVWVELNPKINNDLPADFFLIQKYEHTGIMEVYSSNSSGIYKQYTSIQESSPIRDNFYPVHDYIFHVFRNDDSPIYIRYQPQGHDVVVDIAWTTARGILGYLAEEHLREGLFFGALLVMLIYNGCLYLYLKENTYLYYVYYLFSFIVTFIYIDGLMPLFFGFSIFKEKVFACAPFFALHGMLLFGRKFLELTHGKVNRYLSFFQFASIFCIILPFILPRGHSFIFINILLILSLPGLVLAGFIKMIEGYKPAWVYFMGWFVLAAALSLLALKSLLVIQESWLTDYGVKIGSIWEAMVFSFALAYRLRTQEQETRYKADKAREELQISLSRESNMLKDLHISLGREKEALRKNVRFIAAVNHELRSPVHQLVNVYDRLIANYEIDQENASKIRRLGIQLVSQMKDIGEYSRLEASEISLKIDRVDLLDLLYALEDDIKEEMQSKNNVHLLLDFSNAPEFDIYTDGSKLRQVIFNLVQNSIKYTAEGFIKLSVEFRKKSESNLRETLIILVEDTGLGISVEDQIHIFEPFWQSASTEKKEGSGLGLAIVKSIVELLSGNIVLVSSPSKGTQFTIKIPVNSSVSVGSAFNEK